jgi:hypothetical protein
MHRWMCLVDEPKSGANLRFKLTKYLIVCQIMLPLLHLSYINLIV